MAACLLLSVAGCQESRRAGDTAPDSQPLMASVQSHKGLFDLTLYVKGQTAPPINRYHNWVIVLSDEDGEPVYPAAVAVGGGMPTHGHGLPTQPKVTRHLGEGEYLLEGVKFNMDGQWRLHFKIFSGDLQDTAEVSFNVDY